MPVLGGGFALLGWLVRNLWLALACAAAAFAAGAVGLRASGHEPIDAGEYVFTLFLGAVWTWPLYMVALWLLGRRGRFRLWAFGLCLDLPDLPQLRHPPNPPDLPDLPNLPDLPDLPNLPDLPG